MKPVKNQSIQSSLPAISVGQIILEHLKLSTGSLLWPVESMSLHKVKAHTSMIWSGNLSSLSIVFDLETKNKLVLIEWNIVSHYNFFDEEDKISGVWTKHIANIKQSNNSSEKYIVKCDVACYSLRFPGYFDIRYV